MAKLTDRQRIERLERLLAEILGVLYRAGTPLAGWLTEHGIRRVIVTGIRTEQCCETTTRHASDSGWAVDYVTGATLTFEMVHPKTGRRVTPDEIRDRTELVLADRFARVVTVEQTLNDL